ncbi:MAG: anti-sigma factor [Capsulimonadaceae bacterium]|nr:anti-sigma factor [Capsulimonadaceae bacterium]
MNCKDMESLIHGYMDGELDPLTNQSVERHIEGCTSCARDLANFRELRSGLRLPGVYLHAPAEMERRVLSQIPHSAVSNANRALNWRSLLAFASACVVLLSVWVVGSRQHNPNPDDAAATEVVASHVRSLMADHLVDVRSSDKHTVKPWFAGKLDYSPPVQLLAGTEFPLAGGRLDYLDGQPVAALVYRHKKHTINLFVWPQMSANPRFETSAIRGYNLVHWSDHGMTHWATSDMTARDLLDFAHLIRSAGG